jgi:hypothetical protein
MHQLKPKPLLVGINSNLTFNALKATNYAIDGQKTKKVTYGA